MFKLRDMIYYGLMCLGLGLGIYIALLIKDLLRTIEQWLNQN